MFYVTKKVQQLVDTEIDDDDIDDEQEDPVIMNETEVEISSKTEAKISRETEAEISAHGPEEEWGKASKSPPLR